MSVRKIKQNAPLVTIILPTYNEEEQIAETICKVDQELKAALTKLELDYTYEILIVDDGSVDQTWTVVRSMLDDYPGLRAVRFSRNFGKESAILAGLREAEGQAAVLMDSDLQHPPKHLYEMIDLWLNQGFDIVEGVKSTRGKESFLSKANAKYFYRMFKRYSGLNLDNASDFKLMDRKVLAAWKQLNEQDPFFRGLAAWVGYTRTTFEFDVEERKHGSSKWSFFQLLKLSANAITGFSAKPLLYSAFFGIFLVFVFVALGIQTLINYLNGHAVAGFTTVILLQLIIGGAILLSLGLVGLYLARIFNEAKNRPHYLIAEDTAKEE